MKEAPTQCPDVKSYLSIHLFLQDYYKYRKASNANFSYESWARELGIKSRSYLRLVVIGKRSLNDEVATLISQKLSLSDKDHEYFSLLILYSQCRSHEQKKLYGKKMMQILKTEMTQYEVENHMEFLSSATWPRLQTLLSFEDIEKTPEALSKLLEEPVQKIESGLQVLKKIEMADIDNSNQWIAKHRSFKVPEKLGDIALEIYHTHSLQNAIKAQKLPRQQRRFRSIMMALNEDEFKKLLEELQSFVERQLSQFDFSNLKGRRLYQINFNAFPVSRQPEEIEPASSSN